MTRAALALAVLLVVLAPATAAPALTMTGGLMVARRMTGTRPPGPSRLWTAPAWAAWPLSLRQTAAPIGCSWLTARATTGR